ncbi:MAG TPA: D-alanyl-D-alanine carboxypeptidase/D-alanyl-D-alanine-endopeptidase [Longimicrobiales bacterium]|nr:D-alanyl-D-alanine carboxypeptidase/D-alanyl-D-alanine-endopeptidase [Longimicrobiales bacterium]
MTPPRLRSRSFAAAAALLAACLAPTAARAQDVAELRESILDAFGSVSWRNAQWGAMIVSLDAGDTLFALAADTPLAPASNLKLITTAAALRVLGPDYRFRTLVLTDGEVRNGVVEGDLVLYGGGDPGISDRFYATRDEVFHRLADQLEELGIHAVAGDLVGDASFFAGPLRPEGWDPRDLNEHFSAAVSALSFNENVVSFRVVPTAPGEPPRVETVPEAPSLEIVNHAETVAANPRPRLAILREDPLEPVRVEGRIASGARDVWREMTVSVPARFAASRFRMVLESRGIEVRGDVRVVTSPEESVVTRISAPALGRRGARILARHVSPPLSVYLEVINKESHNLFAEIVYRTVGRAVLGEGSPEAAAHAIRAELARMGADVSHVVQLDGSGLSAGNRVSAATFVRVLQAMASSPDWPVFWATLPEAGRRGELGRMYDTPAARNLRAKTGTIEGVSALSGVVRARDGERIVFSLLVNDTPSQSRAKTVENRIGVLLASYSRAPSGEAPVRLAAAPLPRAEEIPEMHEIRSGENLSVIAGRYGVSVEEILRLNPRLDPERLAVGQWIEIPRVRGTQ